jgi:hypothetical protein
MVWWFAFLCIEVEAEDSGAIEKIEDHFHQFLFHITLDFRAEIIYLLSELYLARLKADKPVLLERDVDRFSLKYSFSYF